MEYLLLYCLCPENCVQSLFFSKNMKHLVSTVSEKSPLCFWHMLNAAGHVGLFFFLVAGSLVNYKYVWFDFKFNNSVFFFT